MRFAFFIVGLVVLSLTDFADASVVTGQLGFTANVTSFVPGNTAFPPNSSTIAATVAPVSPLVDTAGITLQTTEANLGSGLDINRFAWTVTSTTPLNQVVFTPTNPSAEIRTVVRTVQVAGVPAGWARIVSPTALTFHTLGHTLLPANSVTTFIFDLDISDLTTGPLNQLGSFDLNLTASNPEPTSMALCGLLSLFAGGYSLRKKRAVTEQLA